MVLVGFLVTHWIVHTHAEPSRLYSIQYTYVVESTEIQSLVCHVIFDL